MKSLFAFTVAIVMSLGTFSCTAQTSKKADETTALASKIEVYYFHFTRRCMTCNAVETESKSAIEGLYPQQVKNGSIVFTGVNLDDATSKGIAEKCKAGGQGLLIISGNKRIDLTSQGFMYAVNNPDKLRDEIKKAVDPLLASK